MLLVLGSIQSEFVSLKSGPAVSKLGIGTWAWGDSLYWKYDPKEDVGLQETFDYCLKEGGVNLFDTAEVYGFGRSELLLGRFNRQIKDCYSPISPYLATKFAPLPWRIGADSVLGACQDSLDRMGVDSMDLYQIHWPGVWQNKEYWDGIARCYDKGLIKAVGVSNYGPEALKSVHKFLDDRGVPLSTNQIQFSLLSRSAETSGLLRTASDLGVSILAYSPLAQGVLTGKFDLSNLPKGPRASTVKKVLPKTEALLSTMRNMALKKSEETGFEVSMAQIALNWCIAKGTIPIPGARSKTQAISNCNALKWSLSIEDVTLLDVQARSTGVEMPTPLLSK